jgi:DNA processing protein
MNRVKERLIHIHHCRGITWKRIQHFILKDPTLKSVFHYCKETLVNQFKWSEKQASLFIKDLHSLQMKRILKKYKSENIKVVTIFDQEYPALLKQIFDPPWVLYCKGNISLFDHQKNISIVGTRKPTHYGIKAVHKIISPLIKQEWTIISGLAFGVDTFAHIEAIIQRGQTIAVLGCGFNYIYPARNKHLSNLISTKHLLVSEFPPNTRPNKWMFPLRNRIISGLSLGTFVVEARSKSGSLITANAALSEGREVFALPGSIFELNAEGVNKLIQSGAHLVMSGEDIIQQLAPMLE